MKQTLNPGLKGNAQLDVNLEECETCQVAIMPGIISGQHVLYIDVDGVNVMRLYSDKPIQVSSC